ncbi:MAG: hypothetical protein IPJ31_04355 [Bacteroidetes bacterium]|nr:hypothetical protein [Bacteroidota bacterium]
MKTIKNINEEFDGKKFKIMIVEPEDNRKAIVTHYLHNFRNGVSKHYKISAENCEEHLAINNEDEDFLIVRRGTTTTTF